jgi:periplasmic divalent cation tolerance protein
MESPPDPADVVVVLISWPAERDPDALARPLVERNLAACVNVLAEMRSIYKWEGRVNDDAERLMLLKTTRGRLRDVEALVREVHPYELPEFIVVPVEGGSEAYLRWVRERTSPNGDASS